MQKKGLRLPTNSVRPVSLETPRGAPWCKAVRCLDGRWAACISSLTVSLSGRPGGRSSVQRRTWRGAFLGLVRVPLGRAVSTSFWHQPRANAQRLCFDCPQVGSRSGLAVNHLPRSSRNEKAPAGGAFRGFCGLPWKPRNPLLAEKEGFEPSVQLKLYAGFRIRCIRPLCHLSGVLLVLAATQLADTGLPWDCVRRSREFYQCLKRGFPRRVGAVCDATMHALGHPAKPC